MTRRAREGAHGARLAGLRLAAPLVAAGLALGGLAVGEPASVAAAQSRSSGAVGLIGLFHDERSMSDGRSASGTVERIDYGGGAIADLGLRLGPVRLGGALGLAAVTSADGVRSRVYMPLAASAGLALAADPIEIELRVRAGLWGGATDLGLRADLWASGGVLLGFDLGGGARVQLGVDVWLQRAEVSAASGNRTSLAVYYGPVLGLSWDTPAEVAVEDEAQADTSAGDPAESAAPGTSAQPAAPADGGPGAGDVGGGEPAAAPSEGAPGATLPAATPGATLPAAAPGATPADGARPPGG